MQGNPLIYRWLPPSDHSGSFVILDRDGTLVRDPGYVHLLVDFEWMPGALRTLKYFCEKDFQIFVASNQSGIGRGYFTSRQMEIFNQELVSRAAHEAGAQISAIAICPHSPIDVPDCGCRKPAPGMLEDIMMEYGLDASRGIMIGDSESDSLAASAVNLKAIWLGETHAALDDPTILKEIDDHFK